MDSTYTKSVLPLYFGSLNNASKSGDYKNADDLVESINGFQRGLVVRIVTIKSRRNTV
jgi:hypothetical protein